MQNLRTLILGLLFLGLPLQAIGKSLSDERPGDYVSP